LDVSHFSLLWPAGHSEPEASRLVPETIRDLELEAVISSICSHAAHRRAIEEVLYRPCQDAAVISYRQAVLADLLRHPGLAEALAAALPLLDELAAYTYRPATPETPLYEVVARASELELLVECIRRLSQAFDALEGDLASEGLRALRDYVAAYAADAGFQEMVQALPGLLADLRISASITIGVNLDERLRPQEALLLSVNAERFTESGLLDRLLGKTEGGVKGIASLHTLPPMPRSNAPPGGRPAAGATQRAEPMLVPLFRDLAQVLEKVARPIGQELRRYVHLNGRLLVDLRPETIFYVHAVSFINKLQGLGLNFCRPQIASMEERVCEIEDTYNLYLALHFSRARPGQDLSREVVTNDVSLGGGGRIVILTGPNRGGKTTYMQAVGQIQVLAQAGLFVPGRRARISPVDGIYTHYPAEERLELGTGRFGDEARRIRAIFERVTRYSLVLLNESLSTTSTAESVYLAQDLVRALSQIGLRAIFVTHLHDLAAAVPELNRETDGDSPIITMVASPVEEDRDEADIRYSYRVVPGPPMGRSYADRIAAAYGISREQLMALLHERKVV
jgi:DNA mismatch repair protein MutS